MIAINQIISAFSQQERQLFIAYLTRKNKRSDAKNIQLFKILANGETDSNKICNALYNYQNKNAYHALRKRLFDSLIDFTANKNLENENSVDIEIIKYILASRTFLIQKKYKTAYKILDKAEKLADEHSLFQILNEIYHTKIQYAPNYPEINLQKLISKQNENQQKHHTEDQLNIIYAKLKTAINAINYRGKILNFETLLKNTIKDADIKLDETLSFKSLYQILAIANISASLTSKYFEIEDFVLKSYSILKNKKATDKQLYYQIAIVYIIANTLFRNKKFEKSLQYIDEMMQLMQLKKQTFYKDFLLKHNLLKALNLNYSNKPFEAIALIENTEFKKYTNLEAQLDLNLSLFVFYFQQNKLADAKSVLSKFYHTDNWYIEKAGMDWVIKKNLAELLLLIELKEDNLFYSRLRSFRRLFTKHFKDSKQKRILIFLKFAEYHYKYPEETTSAEFKDEVKKSFIWKNTFEEDIFVISFYAWLKSKIEKRSIYQTTLQILNQ